MIPNVYYFILVLVMMLAFGSWCHLGVAHNVYPGTRWTGLWNNPNIYGVLMGSGGVLAVGLLAANAKNRIKNVKNNSILAIALFMMGVGLLMSYSRGAWVGTTIAMLYLFWCRGKMKWRYVFPVALVAATVIALVWHSTSDTDPWYLKRLDFSRPSAQHRVAAWGAGFEIMRDHPLGVGWNNAVSLYDKEYSPPEGGAGALTMNSYLMLGTELGIPALLCFIVYCGLCLRGKCRMDCEEGRIQAACRAGAILFLVAFWFDGGLFDLPTAAVFWILLEMGSVSYLPYDG